MVQTFHMGIRYEPKYNPNSSKIAWPHDRACHVRGRGLHWDIPIAKKRMENREVLHPLYESNSLTAH